MANQTFTLNIKALFDASDVKAKVGDIQNTLSKLKLPDKLTIDLNKSFANVNKALDDFVSKSEKGVKTKADATGITKSFEKVTTELTNLDNLLVKVKSQLGDGIDLSKIIKIPNDAKNKIAELQKQIDELQKEISKTNISKIEALENSLNKVKTKGSAEHGKKAIEIFKEGDIDGAIAEIDKFIEKLQTFKQTSNITESIDALREMKQAMVSAQTENADSYAEVTSKTQEQANIASNAVAEVTNKLQEQTQAFHETATGASGLTGKMNDLTSSQAQFVREVDQVKSRIQYFFGIANAINLVKRAIRSAVETVKDLDKAMTETAVVTKNTVSDMWAKLPEYTKRANELGVSTLDAYKAATLYYQQGLNDEQAGALSVETLKMARIAGLDAAEATDRMTNALRGFNMELNAVSAQKVDDVYSQLAAMSASNVDEISTAMTKVASLAHNANMEFETTAAFLAQIIETTRESAETAGTALKTVVARFSEVKKLVDTEQLKGTDEEGQVIDVNKVSAALRTAGIDLNKYFLGEVGLDDIFMELASKWDSLTNVQQRYIATQAAGSRQQSRFIALMQDYARTQELVGAAYNANGASARQFEKTQESLQSKLARLKNAWNEFLMGLANNAVIKGVVDGLTTLLNLVNKLTSAFGDGAGSFLKWISVFFAYKGLRSAFSDGGIATKAIGGLIGDSLIGNKIKAALGLGKFDEETGNFERYTKDTKGSEQKSPTIISGINNLKDKAWGGAKSLGEKVGKTKIGQILTGGAGLEGAAAGLTGIVTALGAVALAATAVYVTYQAWLNLTPEGQLKNAQNYAKAMNQAAESTQKNVTQLKKATSELKQYNNKISEANTLTERQKAISEKNEYISQLLEQNSEYAKYLTSTFQDGQLVLELSIDSSELDNAIKGLKMAQAGSDFAQASVAKAQADILEEQLSNIDLTTRTIKYTDEVSGEELSIQMSRQQYAKYSQMELQKENYQAQLQNYAQKAYGELIDTTKVSDEVANLMSEALAEGFNESELPTGSGWWRSRSHWQNEYVKLYGTEADANMKTSDIYRAIQQYGLTQQKDESVSNLEKVMTGPYAKIATSILEGRLGRGAISEKSLLGVDTEDITSIYTLLGLSENDVESFGNALVELSEALGKSTDEILRDLKDRAAAEKKVQAQKTYKTVASMYEGKISAQTIGKYINLDDIQTKQAFENIISSFDTSFLSEEFTSNLLDGLKAGDTKLTEWLNSFDLSNPIAAFNELSDKAANAEGSIQSTAAALLEAGISSQQFSNSAQLGYFLTSSSFESLQESLEDFISENGKINSANIQELAASNNELNRLLENNITSAAGLATILTHIQDGSINVWELSDAVIAATSAMDDLDGMVQSTIEDLNGFDPGYDENDVTSFIQKVLDNAKGNIEKGAVGNNQMHNYMSYIFGDFDKTYDPEVDGNYGDAYNSWLNEHVQWLEDNKENMYSAWSDIAPTLNEAFQGVGKVYESGGKIILDAGGRTTEQLVAQMVATGKVTEQQARMMIADYKNYSDEFRYIMEQNDFGPAMQKWYDSLKSNADGLKIYDEEDLDTLSKLLDVSKDKIEDWIKDVNKDAEKARGIKFTDEDDKRTKSSIESAWSDIGIETDMHSTDHGRDEIFDYDEIKQQYESLGIGNMFQKDFDTVLKSGDTFWADFFGQGRAVTIKEGQTAGEAYAEEYQKAVNEDLAGKIGQELTDIFSNVEIKINTEGGVASLEILSQTVTDTESTTTNAASTVNGTEFSPSADTTELGTLSNKLTEIINKITTAQQKAAEGVNVQTSTTEDGVATGAIVKSYAKGSENFHISPGIALTGEEGPEIVWNKEQGYAYVTGEDGPEFQNLQPGDRVFNNSETKRIFKNSSLAKGGIVPSYGGGTDNISDAYGDANKSNNNGNSNNSKKSKENEKTWRNELDWLYDLLEDIANYEKKQTEIQSKYELALKDVSKTGKDLYNLTKQELSNLQTQYNAQSAVSNKRRAELNQLNSEITSKKLQSYVQWNNKENKIEIDWTKINKITDKDRYDEVTDYIKRLEDAQGKLDDADKALLDIKKQIQELQNRYLEKYLDFQKRVYDAVVKQYQKVIDEYSVLNDTITDTNDSILDSIQKEIDLQRQIRDNTDTESEIADLETRLAYLRRDTTGANAQEIRELERQLDEMRRDYSDTLVDQAVDRLSDANEASAEQRDKEIEIMQSQLDFLKENGGFWTEVADLIAGGFDGNGSILQGSELYEILKQADSWDALSASQKESWANELILETNEVGAYIIQLKNDSIKKSDEIRASIIGTKDALAESIKGTAESIRALAKNLTDKLGGTPTSSKAPEHKGYASGGLANKTGYAMLHGTVNEPEYVLNARQTEAFLRLADVLPTAMTGNTASTIYGGNATFNIGVTVDSISNDYDVDRLVERIKDDLADAAGYRNVNALSFIR